MLKKLHSIDMFSGNIPGTSILTRGKHSHFLPQTHTVRQVQSIVPAILAAEAVVEALVSDLLEKVYYSVPTISVVRW